MKHDRTYKRPILRPLSSDVIMFDTVITSSGPLPVTEKSLNNTGVVSDNMRCLPSRSCTIGKYL
jgi:hypothetical protein